MHTQTTLQKNEHYELTIEDMGSSGEGIGKINGFTVFVEGALIGDKIECRIVKCKKNYAYGKLISILSPSLFFRSELDVFVIFAGGTAIEDGLAADDGDAVGMQRRGELRARRFGVLLGVGEDVDLDQFARLGRVGQRLDHILPDARLADLCDRLEIGGDAL